MGLASELLGQGFEDDDDDHDGQNQARVQRPDKGLLPYAAAAAATTAGHAITPGREFMRGGDKGDETSLRHHQQQQQLRQQQQQQQQRLPQQGLVQNGTAAASAALRGQGAVMQAEWARRTAGGLPPPPSLQHGLPRSISNSSNNSNNNPTVAAASAAVAAPFPPHPHLLQQHQQQQHQHQQYPRQGALPLRGWGTPPAQAPQPSGGPTSGLRDVAAESSSRPSLSAETNRLPQQDIHGVGGHVHGHLQQQSQHGAMAHVGAPQLVRAGSLSSSPSQAFVMGDRGGAVLQGLAQQAGMSGGQGMVSPGGGRQAGERSVGHEENDQDVLSYTSWQSQTERKRRESEQS